MELSEIKKIPIVGNHASDHRLLVHCGKFITDKSNEMNERIECIKIWNDITGMVAYKSTETGVLKFTRGSLSTDWLTETIEESENE